MEASFFVIAALLLGLIPATIASKKGERFARWWAYGTFLFIVALPMAIILQPRNQKSKGSQRDVLEPIQSIKTDHDLLSPEVTLSIDQMKRCPFCGEEILAIARKCKHCGSVLDERGTVEPSSAEVIASQIQPTSKRWGTWGVAIAVVLGLLLIVTAPTKTDFEIFVTERTGLNNEKQEPNVLETLGSIMASTALAAQTQCTNYLFFSLCEVRTTLAEGEENSGALVNPKFLGILRQFVPISKYTLIDKRASRSETYITRSESIPVADESVPVPDKSALDPEPYLFDLLAKLNYREAWDALFLGEQDVDEWLAQYAETTDGPSSPGTTIKLSGSSYQICNVCKTGDCGDNMFYVLFAQDGSKAWGLLLRDGNVERFFGDPDEEKKNALRTAAYEY